MTEHVAQPPVSRNVSAKNIWSYSIGEGGTSIAINGVSNFALLFYTQVLGLNAAMAGLALSISVLWDAVSDPIMGYISDNTKSRYGRRHLYMFLGGILLSLSFVALWTVPDALTHSSTALFTYLLIVNLIMRTSLTVFVVPFTALGFEICKGYESRAQLQGVRAFINMAVNFIFGALAWTLFFQDSVDANGLRIDGTTDPDNFIVMGMTLGLSSLVMVMLCVFLTREYAKSADNPNVSMGLKAFVKSTKEVLSDRLAVKVFIMLFIAQIGMMLTAQLQIFAFVDFMDFSSSAKTFVHGSTMVGFAVGALAISFLVNFLEKSRIFLLGVCISTLGGVVMYLVYSVDIFGLDLAGKSTQLSVSMFAVCQAMFWLGCGIIVPLSTSMIGDVSAINNALTGESKDGSYSAMLSFAIKASTSFALLISGSVLTLNGYVEGLATQTPEVAKQIATSSFLLGPVFLLIACIFLRNYSVDRDAIAQIKSSS